MFRALFFALAAVSFFSSGVQAAIMEAVWTGKVVAAEDQKQTLASDPALLVGLPVTYRAVYDTSVGRASSPSGQSITGGLMVGPNIFRSQSFTVGGLRLPQPSFVGYYDSVELAGLVSGAYQFSIRSSVSEGRISEPLAWSISVSLLLGSAYGPLSLETPFAWDQEDGGEASGAFNDQVYSFEFQGYRKYISLGLAWDSVRVSAVPGPASGLLLLSGLLTAIISARVRRLRR